MNRTERRIKGANSRSAALPPTKQEPVDLGTTIEMRPSQMGEAIALSSPSGHMSKAARQRATERLRHSLFGDGLPAHAHNLFMEGNLMTPNQAKKIAAEHLRLNGFEFDKLTAKTVSFSDLARGSALFVDVKGLRDTVSATDYDAFVSRFDTNPRASRWQVAKTACKAAGFILSA